MAAMNSLLLAALLLAPQAPADDRTVEIFNGRDLTGWKAHGDARYVVEDGAILGETTKGGHSFLVTERSFGDFVFEVDVKTEKRGNSGIQIRSQVTEKGRMVGYQIEIDPSERSWSGGLYDEGRRGWLQNLEGREEARAAFRFGEWNSYRIECRGPWIRTWINGVPITDHLDPVDAAGVIGLQVHSGKNTRVRWGALELLDLGTRTWSPTPPVEPVNELTVRWTHDLKRPALLHFPLPKGNDTWDPEGGDAVAPGITVKDGVWTVAAEQVVLVDGDGKRRVAVCCVGGRVSVFVANVRVADAHTGITTRGLPQLTNAPDAEFLGAPTR
jgi:hypothetical protein